MHFLKEPIQYNAVHGSKVGNPGFPQSWELSGNFNSVMENCKIPLTIHGIVYSLYMYIYIFFSVLKYFLFCERLRSLYNDNDVSKSLSWKSVLGNSLVRKCGNPGNLNSSPFTCKTETVLVLKWVTANTFLQMFHKILLGSHY